MKKITSIYIFLLIVFNSCQRVPGEFAATIAGYKVAKSDVFNILSEDKYLEADETVRRRAVSEAAVKVWLTHDAIAKGFDTHPDVENRVLEIYETKIVDHFVKTKIWNSVLSDSALQTTYMQLQKTVGLSHILIQYDGARNSKSKRSEKNARTKAYKLWKQILNKETSFNDAAFSFTEDPLMKDVKGNLGYIYWGGMLPEVLLVAWNDDSPKYPTPIRSDMGYHLIWKKGTKKVIQKPFEEVKSEIKKLVESGRVPEFKMAMKDLEKDLFNQYIVRIDTQAVHALFEKAAEQLKTSWRRFEYLTKTIDFDRSLAKIGTEKLYFSWFKNRVAILPVFDGSIITRKYDLYATLYDIIVRYLVVKESEKIHLAKKAISEQSVQKLRNKYALQAYKDELMLNDSLLNEEILINRVLMEQSVKINEFFVKGQ